MPLCSLDFERLSQIGSFLGGAGAIIALFLTLLVWIGQRKLSNQLQTDQATLTKQLHDQQATLTKQLHEQQQRFEQRQLLIPIWGHLQDLSDIDPREPVWIDVIKAVNKLELVALSVEGGLLESEVFMRAFGQTFLELCDRISQVQEVGPTGKTGQQLITDARAVDLLLLRLRDEQRNRDKLTPFQQAAGR